MALNPSDIESIVRKIVSEMNAGEKHECCGGHGGAGGGMDGMM